MAVFSRATFFVISSEKHPTFVQIPTYIFVNAFIANAYINPLLQLMITASVKARGFVARNDALFRTYRKMDSFVEYLKKKSILNY